MDVCLFCLYVVFRVVVIQVSPDKFVAIIDFSFARLSIEVVATGSGANLQISC
jgi:hypothetical protein